MEVGFTDEQSCNCLGADYALDPFEPKFAETVRRLTNGGVKVALEVTGRGQGLDMVLDCMADFGRVAFTYDKIPVSLEIETDYPVDGHIKPRVLAERPVRFKLKLCNPVWLPN